jgi:trk system potassium uptake protein TrkH
MHLYSILRLLGLLLMLFSITLLPTVAVSLLYQDGQMLIFLASACTWLLLGCVMWLPVRRHREELRVRDGFLIVVFFWLVLGFAGALPLALTAQPELSITDAVFESFSGLTTTGATVISRLDALPASILFYRQLL